MHRLQIIQVREAAGALISVLMTTLAYWRFGAWHSITNCHNLPSIATQNPNTRLTDLGFATNLDKGRKLLLVFSAKP
jgi:hypothetical protein